jgi:hypothetical protein
VRSEAGVEEKEGIDNRNPASSSQKKKHLFALTEFAFENAIIIA